MSRRDRALILHQMLDHAREAVLLAQGQTRADLDANRVLSLALVRLLEIIGEAASRMPREGCARYSEIPWPEIVALRNRLIHGYDAIDLDIVWQILSNDLPNLVQALETLVAAEDWK